MRCPQCGGDTGTDAQACPRCGAAPPADPSPAGPSAVGPEREPGDDATLVETRFADIPPAEETFAVPAVQGRQGRPGGRGPAAYAGWLVAGAFALALAAVLIVLWPSDRARQGGSTGGSTPQRQTSPQGPAQTAGQASPAAPDTGPDVGPEVGRERFFVDTFAAAEGYERPAASGAPVGELRRGRHYVFCKRWGQRMERNGGEDFNHWWLLTDLDEVYASGGASRAWVPALYLTHWGNDEARDNAGRDIPVCPR
ncbi:hypothetical protein Acsp03_08530 [Actinomadura sp. NBRC 104412]|uniref:hypothetical protein n=1 Tax=Actinomadura sp. NBRC 104412 TaxID=3032203 RepID=UPI0024A3384D|nr:hypothetical protein [Actinomadura sp. NBRC 104412]GLZ03386.1 hypothetical protein Acsp03_08530 [Actinomadura sp. NBRC 104412]